MAEPGQNPFETPRPRGIRAFQGVLRVTVALTCFGAAAAHLHNQQPDLFCDLIGKGRELPADQIAHISNIVAYCLVAFGIFTLLRPTNVILLPLIIYFAGTAFSALVKEDSSSAVTDIALQATRFIAPLALMLVDFWPPRIKPTLVMCLSATMLLKFATAATLIAHGILCVNQAQHGGTELDLYHAALQHGIRESFTLDDTRRLLTAVGMIEIGLAISLMTGRSKLVMFSCGVIGFLTAAVYTIADGPTGYSQTLIRISQAGAPLAMLVFHATSVKEQLPIYLAEHRKPAAPIPSPSQPKKK